MIRIDDYPELALLAWNRKVREKLEWRRARELAKRISGDTT